MSLTDRFVKILIVVSLMFSFTGLLLILRDDPSPVPYSRHLPILPKAPQQSGIMSPTVLVERINKERGERRLIAVRENRNLTYLAFLRAGDIFINQELAHEATRSGLTFAGAILRLGHTYKHLKENLAMGIFSEQEIVRRWMESESHRDVLLTEGEVDVGVYTMAGEFYGNKTVVAVLVLGQYK